MIQRGNLYVAGSSTEMDRADGFMLLARAAGWKVTHDWVEVIRDSGHEPNPNPADMALHDARAFAMDDLFGVREAATFVLLCPRDGSPARGAYVEFGYAIALRKRCLVVLSPNCNSIFHAMATHRVDSDEGAIAWLQL